MARNAFLALSVLVFGSVVVAGLSSVDGDLAFEDWQAEVNAICQEFEPRLAEAEASHGVIRTVEQAVALFDTAIPILGAYNRAIIAVGVPSERSDDVVRFVRSLEIEEERVADIRQALFHRDVETFRWLIAVQAPAYEYLNARASGLGVPACDSRDASAGRA